MEPTLEAQFDHRTLVSTLYYLEQSRADGRFRLETPEGQWGDIYLEQGRIVYVDTYNGKSAQDLAELLNWQQGSLRFYRGLKPPEHTMKLVLESLLPSEAAPLAQDALPASQISLNGESVLIANEVLSVQDDTASISYLGVQMLLHIDGKRSLAAIAQLSEQPLASILPIAQQLYDTKMLQLVGTRPIYLHPAFFEHLVQMATPYFGPIAEFLVDDCVEDMGYTNENFPYSQVSKLFTSLRQHLERSDWQRAFKKDFQTLCEHYGIRL